MGVHRGVARGWTEGECKRRCKRVQEEVQGGLQEGVKEAKEELALYKMECYATGGRVGIWVSVRCAKNGSNELNI